MEVAAITQISSSSSESINISSSSAAKGSSNININSVAIFGVPLGNAHLNTGEICSEMEQLFPMEKFPEIHTDISGLFF